MCWMCDHPGSTVADFLDVIRAKIDKRGWAVQYVEDPRMPFAYTAGMTGLLLPELLMTNVSPARAARVLNGMAELLLDGLELWPGRQVSLPGGPLVEVVEVDQPDVHLPAADFCDEESRQPVLGMRDTANWRPDAPQNP